VNCLSSVAGSVVVAIKAVDEASSVFEKIQASMGILGASLSQLGGGFESAGSIISGFAGGGVIGAAAAGIGELIKGLKWSTEEAAASEQAWVNLQAAIGATGPAWDAIKNQVSDFASAIQKSTTQSDEAVIGAIQRMTTFGMSYQDAMKAVGVAVDLAAAKHIDLETAADLLGKTFTGNSAILSRYGIDVKGIKDSMGEGATQADVYAAVLTKLNDQFGGQAAAQAQTYAGTQERLKNAVSDLGEKIGGIMIPALAGVTEGMIPVVDWLGRGVDAVQAWITEVSKMPEVQQATDALSTAFSGLQKWLTDFAKVASEELGPALQELWSAFKDLWDALSPIGEAIGEVISALTDGASSGDILRDILGLVADSIKMVALAIKTAAPYIKMLAEAFKDAAEFITPILVTLRDVIGGFIGWLRDTFDAFYNFLVGHSLWQDLWDGLVSIARRMGDVLGGVAQGMIDTVKGIFQLGMDAINTILSTGFNLAFATAQGIVSAGAEILKGLIQGVQNVIQGTTKDWSDLVSAVSANVNAMKDTINQFWDWALGFWTEKLTALVDFSRPKFDDIASKVQETSNTMQSVWSSALSTMVSRTRSAFDQMLADISSRVDAIISRLRAAQSEISMHSIWPDMLGQMISQTHDAMAAIQDEFSQGFQSPGGIIPTIQSAAPTVESATAAPTAAPAAERQAIAVPVNVYLDGQQIQSFLERRLVETISRDAGRSRRA
jgi:prophage DNA circulation protein